MFAPVVHRFRTYAIEVKGDARHYFEAMQAHAAFQQWTREGLAETIRIERFEAV
jgi:glutathione S-transferase